MKNKQEPTGPLELQEKQWWRVRNLGPGRPAEASAVARPLLPAPTTTEAANTRDVMCATCFFFLVDVRTTTLLDQGTEMRAPTQMPPARVVTRMRLRDGARLFDFATPGTPARRHAPDPNPTLAVLRYDGYTFVWLLGKDPLGPGISRDRLKALRKRARTTAPSQDADAAEPPAVTEQPPSRVVQGANRTLRSILRVTCPETSLPSNAAPLPMAVATRLVRLALETSASRPTKRRRSTPSPTPPESSSEEAVKQVRALAPLLSQMRADPTFLDVVAAPCRRVRGGIAALVVLLREAGVETADQVRLLQRVREETTMTQEEAATATREAATTTTTCDWLRRCGQTLDTIHRWFTQDPVVRRTSEQNMVELVCAPTSPWARLLAPVTVKPSEIAAALADPDSALLMRDDNAAALSTLVTQLYDCMYILAVACDAAAGCAVAGARDVGKGPVRDHLRALVDKQVSFLGITYRKIHSVARANRGCKTAATRRIVMRRLVRDAAEIQRGDAFVDEVVALVTTLLPDQPTIRKHMHRLADQYGIQYTSGTGTNRTPDVSKLFDRARLVTRFKPVRWLWFLMRRSLASCATADTATTVTQQAPGLTPDLLLRLCFREATGLELVRVFVGWYAVAVRHLAELPSDAPAPKGIITSPCAEKRTTNLFGPVLHLAIDAFWAFVEREFLEGEVAPDGTRRRRRSTTRRRPGTAGEDRRSRRRQLVGARLTTLAAAWCLQVWFGFRPHMLEELQVCTVDEYAALDPKHTCDVDMQFGIYVVYDQWPDPRTLRVHVHDSKPVARVGTKRRRNTNDDDYRHLVHVRTANQWVRDCPAGMRRVLPRLIAAYRVLTADLPRPRCYLPDLRLGADGSFVRVHIHTVPWPTTTRNVNHKRFFIHADVLDVAPPQARRSHAALRAWIADQIRRDPSRRFDFAVRAPPHLRSFHRIGWSQTRNLSYPTVRRATEVLRQFLRTATDPGGVHFHVATHTTSSKTNSSLGLQHYLPGARRDGRWDATRAPCAKHFLDPAGPPRVLRGGTFRRNAHVTTLRILAERVRGGDLRIGFDRAGRHGSMARLLAVERFLRSERMCGAVQDAYATLVRDRLCAEMSATMRREAHLNEKIVRRHYDELAASDKLVDIAAHLDHMDARLKHAGTGSDVPDAQGRRPWPDHLVVPRKNLAQLKGANPEMLARAGTRGPPALDYDEQTRQLLWLDGIREVCRFTERHRQTLEASPLPPTSLFQFVAKVHEMYHV